MRKILMRAGILAGAALACLPAAAQTFAPSAPAPFALGVYIGGPNASDSSAEALVDANYASFTQAMGVAPTLIDVYTDYSQTIGSWQLNASWQAFSNSISPVAKTMIPVVAFPMASQAAGSPSPDQQFQLFATGQYDWAIQGVVQAWIAQGFHNLIFRVGWEMDLNYSVNYAGDDSGTQADWVAAFQHIYQVIHQTAAAAGATVQVVWNPSATNYTNAVATTSLYPGDSYVDVIGVDVYGAMYPYYDNAAGSGVQIYDWATGQIDTNLVDFISKPANRIHYWRYPAAYAAGHLDGSGGHSQSFDSVLSFAKAHNKPFAVPECGSGAYNDQNDVADDGAFPWWLATTLKHAQANGLQVAFVSIWDTDNEGDYQFSYKTNNQPATRHNWAKYLSPLVAH